MNDQSKWPMWIFWMGMFALSALLAWNNALTTTADLIRNQVTFKTWQPYIWEYSSFLSSFLLYFGIYWLANNASLLNQNWLRNFFIHVLASVIFSILHVLLMVWLREIIYYTMGGEYDFGDWLSEWLYEYRKDVITYFIFLTTVYAFQYFSKPEPSTASESVIKKLKVINKQGIFWINCIDITTIESGGNYVYIHANGQVQPMRSTMADIEAQVDPADFIRVHRSYIVNLDHCKGIQKQSNDVSELIMLNDKTVPVSKKYRPKLLTSLQQKNN
jgi:hypothetical protein